MAVTKQNFEMEISFLFFIYFFSTNLIFLSLVLCPVPDNVTPKCLFRKGSKKILFTSSENFLNEMLGLRAILFPDIQLHESVSLQ